MKTNVLIVGAGPIGLALAGDLGFRGIESTLIERTDTCLYAAKRHGRNRVMCETDPEVATNVAAQVA